MNPFKGIVDKKERPIKILQYGEGNFLRGFILHMIDVANEKGVFDGNAAVVKPIPFGSLESFKEQDNIYTLSLRGKQDGKIVDESRIITCIGETIDCYTEYEKYEKLAEVDSLEFVISNTTEAGIVFDEKDKFDSVPPHTYPGKLTKFLFKRYSFFEGDESKGLIMLPVELIENNGGKLKDCILNYTKLWNLGEGFEKWICENNVFCNTLVDRIITGYPKDEAEEMFEKLGYRDNLLDTGEPFGLWVIESDKDISSELPLDKAGMNVVFTNNLKPYRDRKVRLLNGAHTGTVLAAYLAGKDIVRECMEDKTIRTYMDKLLFDEIGPTVDLPKDEVEAFTNAVIERFENPFIRHSLLAISLNSVSKWKARILPTFRDSVKNNGSIPKFLTFSFAALMAFYKTDVLEDGALIGKRGEETYKIMDDKEVLDFFAAHVNRVDNNELTNKFASDEKFWGEDLTQYENFAKTVAAHLDAIDANGMRATLEQLIQEA
ncbi:MAG: Tagaturonate reductase [Clostridia bacterium]|jgi:tagaturonate reductase|nr:Tagaturonate reductase [Clostridia bacterium]